MSHRPEFFQTAGGLVRSGAIRVFNGQRKIKVDCRFIRKQIQCLRTTTQTCSFDVGLKFTGHTGMKKLNRYYRGIGETTDVLAFPNYPVCCEELM
mmetsp:Transcript_15192/g.38373  ORF Transcript_15192/g.38373 Transcript_15192/m.38373 type:complete len:95 (-) Transcript_15192:65-349(-)